MQLHWVADGPLPMRMMGAETYDSGGRCYVGYPPPGAEKKLDADVKAEIALSNLLSQQQMAAFCKVGMSDDDYINVCLSRLTPPSLQSVFQLLHAFSRSHREQVFLYNDLEYVMSVRCVLRAPFRHAAHRESLTYLQEQGLHRAVRLGPSHCVHQTVSACVPPLPSPPLHHCNTWAGVGPMCSSSSAWDPIAMGCHSVQSRGA